MSTCVNTGLLFRLALSYDIVYLQSISGYLKKVIRATDEVNYGVQQRFISCQFRLCDYVKYDWRVNWIAF